MSADFHKHLCNNKSGSESICCRLATTPPAGCRSGAEQEGGGGGGGRDGFRLNEGSMFTRRLPLPAAWGEKWEMLWEKKTCKCNQVEEKADEWGKLQLRQRDTHSVTHRNPLTVNTRVCVCVRDLQQRLRVYIFWVCLHMSASICVTLGLVFATVVEGTSQLVEPWWGKAVGGGGVLLWTGS